MKRLLILAFTLGSGILCAQTPKLKSYYSDPVLARQAFDKFNDYRKSIGQGPWKWSDSSYSTASAWNREMCETGHWGHTPYTNCIHEIIVGITLSGPLYSDGMDLSKPLSEYYNFIIDSCQSQILHSGRHRSSFCSPLKTDAKSTGPITYYLPEGNVTLTSKLFDAGAVSAYVLDYGEYKIVQLVIQHIQLPNKKPSN